MKNEEKSQLQPQNHPLIFFVFFKDLLKFYDYLIIFYNNFKE
jgi:hypothetical protein